MTKVGTSSGIEGALVNLERRGGEELDEGRVEEGETSLRSRGQLGS